MHFDRLTKALLFFNCAVLVAGYRHIRDDVNATEAVTTTSITDSVTNVTTTDSVDNKLVENSATEIAQKLLGKHVSLAGSSVAESNLAPNSTAMSQTVSSTNSDAITSISIQASTVEGSAVDSTNPVTTASITYAAVKNSSTVASDATTTTATSANSSTATFTSTSELTTSAPENLNDLLNSYTPTSLLNQIASAITLSTTFSSSATSVTAVFSPTSTAETREVKSNAFTTGASTSSPVTSEATVSATSSAAPTAVTGDSSAAESVETTSMISTNTSSTSVTPTTPFASTSKNGVPVSAAQATVAISTDVTTTSARAAESVSPLSKSASFSNVEAVSVSSTTGIATAVASALTHSETTAKSPDVIEDNSEVASASFSFTSFAPSAASSSQTASPTFSSSTVSAATITYSLNEIITAMTSTISHTTKTTAFVALSTTSTFTIATSAPTATTTATVTSTASTSSSAQGIATTTLSTTAKATTTTTTSTRIMTTEASRAATTTKIITTTTTMTTQNATPTIALWDMSKQTSQTGLFFQKAWNKCWEASSFTQGAWIVLNTCNQNTPWQAFEVISQGNNTYVLAILGGNPVSDKQSLCVELNDNNFANLQPCRKGYAKQMFSPSQTGSVVSNGYCLSPANVFGVTAIAAYAVAPCADNSAYVVQMQGLGQTAPGFLAAPDGVTSLKIGGKCLTGMSTNPNSVSVTTVVTNTCDGSAEQNWFFQWGQIRNVATGLCLDAPNVSPTDATPISLALSSCNVPAAKVASQFWIRQAGDLLYNGISYNCVHSVDGVLQLGTHRCGSAGQDALAAFPSAVIGSGLFVTSLPSGACQTVVNRKDFRDLSISEQSEFINGLETMQSIPSMLGRLNRYQDYVVFHGLGQQWYHFKAIFLPWHRFFLLQLEQDLQVITGNPNFALPYWGWATDTGTWWTPAANILTPQAFGTTSLTNANYCMNDGFFNKWKFTDYPCAKRLYNANGGNLDVAAPTVLFTDQYMMAITQINPLTNAAYSNFDDFRWALEYPHNMVHSAIGGYIYNGVVNGAPSWTLGHMMDVPNAVNDPLFFLHHNNIERYFTYFQKLNSGISYAGSQVVPPGSGNIIPATMNDLLPGFNIAVSSVWRTGSNGICYQFTAYSQSPAAINVVNSVPVPLAANIVSTLDKVAAKPFASRRDEVDAAIQSKIQEQNAITNAVVSTPNTQPSHFDNAYNSGEQNATIVTNRVSGTSAPSADLMQVMFAVMGMDFTSPAYQKMMEVQDKSNILNAALNQVQGAVLSTGFNATLHNATLAQMAVAIKTAIAVVATGFVDPTSLNTTDTSSSSISLSS